jgi:hypothetical protein
MQPPVVAGQRLNRHLELDARDAPQLLADHGRLEAALRVEAGVLPVAAATTAWPGVPAAWFDAIGGCHQDLHRVGPGEPGGGVGDPGQHALPGQRVPDEHHPPTGLRVARFPGHTPAAVRDLADHQVEETLRTSDHRIHAVLLTGQRGRAGVRGPERIRAEGEAKGRVPRLARPP